MPLKVTVSGKYYQDHLQDSITNKFSDIAERFTESYYKWFDDLLYTENYRKCSLLSAKYMMEYLYHEFGALVCNDGYSLKVIREVRSSPSLRKITNILRLNKHGLSERCVFDMLVIYHIVSKMFYNKTDNVEVYVEKYPCKHLLSWAGKTALNGTLKLNILLDNKDMIKYNMHGEIARLLHINKEACDCIFEKFDEDIMKLTPKRENKKYDIYKRFLAPKEEAVRRNVTAIQIKRCSDESIKMDRLSIVKYPKSDEIYDDIMEDITKNNTKESVVLIYDWEGIVERFVYSDKSFYLMAFKYDKNGLRRIRKDEAFKCFHQLYGEMAGR